MIDGRRKHRVVGLTEALDQIPNRLPGRDIKLDPSSDHALRRRSA